MLSKWFINVLIVFEVWKDACINVDEEACLAWRAEAVKPVLDLANNMRMVLVPGKLGIFCLAVTFSKTLNYCKGSLYYIKIISNF